ncbi:MAG TPA: zinc ribbon domain-containing protein YjdM [Burkholderiaceae bacterium]|nr:zinc ribbon domain-containing protein YjdM [Burkholderiaceae bacterium]
MPTPPACPVCSMENTYQDEDIFICPDCAHEWPTVAPEPDDDERVVVDSNKNPLSDGDTVYLIKDLRVKGSSTILKKGTKIRNIRIIDGDHEIDCKVDGVSYQLKAEFMKKG